MESIYWVISKDCNQRCPHCYNDSRPGGPGLTRDQASQAVANFPDGTSVPVERVIIGGGEPLVWMDLLLHALSELKARYQDRTRLEIQTNGDLLDERAVEQLVSHGLTKISVTAMDPYHAPATLRRRDAIEALLRDSGFVELQEAGERDRLIFDIWGVTEDSWIGALWPRGRALREGLTRATPSDRFCSLWSGGKGFLDYLQTGSEVNIQLTQVYPCCPMTLRPIGDVLEEPLIPMLDRCARHPAFQAINRGCPEALGTSMGISVEQAQRRNEALGNLCLWCDEFFTQHAPDLHWRGASRDDELRGERRSARRG